MRFMHIKPVGLLTLSETVEQPQLILAHLLDTNDSYKNAYDRRMGIGKVEDPLRIMDNGAYENGVSYDPNKLIQLAEFCKATHIVLPDYPGKDSALTIKAALKWAPKVLEAGYKTFFVPQGKVGHLEEYISSFAWAASSPLIDYIGISILAVPNAYNVAKKPLQRFVSRAAIMQELYQRQLLHLAQRNKKKIHFLGMLDGPREITLMHPYEIDSWDSSAASWAATHKVAFDNSPTGLMGGKIATPVDFDYVTTDNEVFNIMNHNIEYIDNLVQAYNKVGEDGKSFAAMAKTFSKFGI